MNDDNNLSTTKGKMMSLRSALSKNPSHIDLIPIVLSIGVVVGWGTKEVYTQAYYRVIELGNDKELESDDKTYDCMAGYCLNESENSLIERGCKQDQYFGPSGWECPSTPWYLDAHAITCSGVVVEVIASFRRHACKATQMRKHCQDIFSDECNKKQTECEEKYALEFYKKMKAGVDAEILAPYPTGDIPDPMVSEQVFLSWKGKGPEDKFNYIDSNWFDATSEIAFERGWREVSDYSPEASFFKTFHKITLSHPNIVGLRILSDQPNARLLEQIRTLHPERTQLCNPVIMQDMFSGDHLSKKDKKSEDGK